MPAEVFQRLRRPCVPYDHLADPRGRDERATVRRELASDNRARMPTEPRSTRPVARSTNEIDPASDPTAATRPSGLIATMGPGGSWTVRTRFSVAASRTASCELPARSNLLPPVTRAAALAPFTPTPTVASSWSAVARVDECLPRSPIRQEHVVHQEQCASVRGEDERSGGFSVGRVRNWRSRCRVRFRRSVLGSRTLISGVRTPPKSSSAETIRGIGDGLGVTEVRHGLLPYLARLGIEEANVVGVVADRKCAAVGTNADPAAGHEC